MAGLFLFRRRRVSFVTCGAILRLDFALELTRSEFEAKQHNVAVLHDVVLAFLAQLAGNGG